MLALVSHHLKSLLDMFDKSSREKSPYFAMCWIADRTLCDSLREVLFAAFNKYPRSVTHSTPL